MKRSTTLRIAILTFPVVAVTAIGGTSSGAGDAPTTSCQTWHPRIIVSGRYQHTWHPDAVESRYQHTWHPDAVESRYQHTWHPDAVDRRHQHTWHPDAVDRRHQHTWHPDDAIEGRYQHTWNPAGDRTDACLSPSPTTP